MKEKYKAIKIIPTGYLKHYYKYEFYENKSEFYTSEPLVSIDGEKDEEGETHKFEYEYVGIKLECTNNILYEYDEFENSIVLPFIKLKKSYFFRNFKIFEFFEILAIINNETPNIEFDFYKVGEKYGFSETTRVNYENKIVKNFYIIEDDIKLTINEYYKKFKIKNDSEYISFLVSIYLDDLYYVPDNNNDTSYEEKYTIEDSYYDAGGGQEWSDPDEFW